MSSSLPRNEHHNRFHLIMADLPQLVGMDKDRVDQVVEALKRALSKDELRALSQRAVQCKVWHMESTVADLMSHLRHEEELVRSAILKRVSQLVYSFHEHTMDATLARAGILQDARIHAGSSLGQTEKEFDLFCLDAKERLYVMLKQYGWLQDFFRLYPQHFYENSFQFVDRIPTKKIKAKVKVIGLGIGGSMAVSGLAKAGIESVIGYEKREFGAAGVSSRYQNASWRAYDIASRLLDEEAYQHLIKYRQRINVTYDDGTSDVVTSDRVQIILGSAVESALESAKRYGATLHFGCKTNDEYYHEDESKKNDEDCDIVALFAGAHTAYAFPGLVDAMNILSWPELDSTCKMWLRILPSTKVEPYCARGGEIGAEKWHYTIESARDSLEDVDRVKNNLKKLLLNPKLDADQKSLMEGQLQHIESLQSSLSDGNDKKFFDYIFTNAPANEHNRSKRETVGADGSVVLDGGYTVEVKIATKSTVASGNILDKFGAKLLISGGDACVPPNPLAAYGATLACEAADMLVHLAVGYGHINSILHEMSAFQSKGLVDAEWIQVVKDLQMLLPMYYEARSRSENYFQFVQTLICNLYSLPPFYS